MGGVNAKTAGLNPERDPRTHIQCVSFVLRQFELDYILNKLWMGEKTFFFFFKLLCDVWKTAVIKGKRAPSV